MSELGKTVGIIGGMGAEATAEFYMRLVGLTPAERDQDHLHVLIDSNSKIPDRTVSILEGSSETVDAIVESALRLESMGAELLAMPCNSAHFWYDEINSRVNIPFLNMIEEVITAVKEAGILRVGLLATRGTVLSGVYNRVSGDVELIVPDEEGQERIHSAIYSIKGEAGKLPESIRDVIIEVIDGLRKLEVEGVILGCTEIPILIKPEDTSDMQAFDSTQILVEAVLREAYIS